MNCCTYYQRTTLFTTTNGQNTKYELISPLPTKIFFSPLLKMTQYPHCQLRSNSLTTTIEQSTWPSNLQNPIPHHPGEHLADTFVLHLEAPARLRDHWRPSRHRQNTSSPQVQGLIVTGSSVCWLRQQSCTLDGLRCYGRASQNKLFRGSSHTTLTSRGRKGGREEVRQRHVSQITN